MRYSFPEDMVQQTAATLNLCHIQKRMCDFTRLHNDLLAWMMAAGY